MPSPRSRAFSLAPIFWGKAFPLVGALERSPTHPLLRRRAPATPPKDAGWRRPRIQRRALGFAGEAWIDRVRWRRRQVSGTLVRIRLARVGRRKAGSEMRAVVLAAAFRGLLRGRRHLRLAEGTPVVRACSLGSPRRPWVPGGSLGRGADLIRHPSGVRVKTPGSPLSVSRPPKPTTTTAFPWLRSEAVRPSDNAAAQLFSPVAARHSSRTKIAGRSRPPLRCGPSGVRRPARPLVDRRQGRGGRGA